MVRNTAPGLDRFSQNPAELVGKPVIGGTRIPVELILDLLSGNLDLEEFIVAYPGLTINDVQAALAFGRDAVRADDLRSRQRQDALAAVRK